MRLGTIAPVWLWGTVLAASATLSSGTASAGHLFELPSVLVITKSSNKNQLHYAAQVDDACVPVGEAPVRPYWRMLEREPNETEPLLDGEERVLGLARQEVSGNTVQIALRAMPARTFTVHTQRAKDDRCSSWVGTTIAGVPARVGGVFVRQKLLGVDYVLLTGWSEDGKAVRERISL